MNKLEETLRQFTGTEKYYIRRVRDAFRYTDGIKYLADHAGAYWLLDAIASWQSEPIIKSNQDLSQIQFWKLKVSPDSSAILICERDLDEPVITQKIPLTDFPFQKSRFICVI
jgi:hypothetical protein